MMLFIVLPFTILVRQPVNIGVEPSSHSPGRFINLFSDRLRRFFTAFSHGSVVVHRLPNTQLQPLNIPGKGGYRGGYDVAAGLEYPTCIKPVPSRG
ncbi:MAG: hypothetical protein QXZ62_07935 [Candidatus Caldarchaeum sp.]